MLLATSAADGTCDFVRAATRPASCTSSTKGRCSCPSGRATGSPTRCATTCRTRTWACCSWSPGVGETLRINGRASLVDDPEQLEPLAVESRTPRLALRIEIDEVFTHCPKAFIRSDLWNPETFVDASALPTPGEIDRSLNPAFDAESYDSERAERYARARGCTENVPVPG